MKLTKKARTFAGITLLTVIFAVLVSELRYSGRILPGVKVSDLDVGGLTTKQAIDKLDKVFTMQPALMLRWGSQIWKISPNDFSLKYDANSTTAQATAVGRTNHPVKDWNTKRKIKQNGWTIDPIFSMEESRLWDITASISGQINIPAKDPEISFDKATGIVNVSPGENGQEVDDRLLRQRITLAIKRLQLEPIDIPVVQMLPKLDDKQLRSAQERGQKLVGKKLTIRSEQSDQIWELHDSELITWIDPQNSGWKEQQINEWVYQLAAAVNRPPENATFRIVADGKAEEFKPGKNGLAVKQNELISMIKTALIQLEEGKTEELVYVSTQTTEPTVKTGDANDLGIKERIGRGESWFSGSIDNRIFNIKKATETLNGVLLGPGEIFSFNQVIGEISQATGYKPAYIIKDGRTILGDGGGVCQVSSTLFRAVLRAGLPIEERIAHAYRVSYYEEKSEPGFDATVFQPSPDFVFKNDTPAYILIQTIFDATNKHVIFDIYGTNDNRQVTISKARIWQAIPPPPDLYQDDPNLANGVVRQIEHSAWGAKVAFDWKVTRGDEVLQDRTFYSNYSPWQAVYLRGTKAN